MADRTFFYAPIHVQPGQIFQLEGEKYKHIVNVLRMGKGDSLDVVNGQGVIVSSSIEAITRDAVQCRAQEVAISRNEFPVKITLAVGIVKQQRYEWMVEKITELGVTGLQPVLSDRVVRKGLRMDRLRKKAVAAMQQAERAVLPVISEPVQLSEYFNTISPENSFVAAQNLDKFTLADLNIRLQAESIIIFIGPEGGWSRSEIELFQDRGVRSFRLCPRRLRTETAAVSALSQLSTLLESE